MSDSKTETIWQDSDGRWWAIIKVAGGYERRLVTIAEEGVEARFKWEHLRQIVSGGVRYEN